MQDFVHQQYDVVLNTKTASTLRSSTLLQAKGPELLEPVPGDSY